VQFLVHGAAHFVQLACILGLQCQQALVHCLADLLHAAIVDVDEALDLLAENGSEPSERFGRFAARRLGIPRKSAAQVFQMAARVSPRASAMGSAPILPLPARHAATQAARAATTAAPELIQSHKRTSFSGKTKYLRTLNAAL
jgi:hypothetical protein